MRLSLTRIFLVFLLSKCTTEAINPEFVHAILEREARLRTVSILIAPGNGKYIFRY